MSRSVAALRHRECRPRRCLGSLLLQSILVLCNFSYRRQRNVRISSGEQQNFLPTATVAIMARIRFCNYAGQSNRLLHTVSVRQDLLKTKVISPSIVQKEGHKCLAIVIRQCCVSWLRNFHC